MASVSAICPTCHAEYPPKADVCPDDGARLIQAGRSADDRVGETLDDKLVLTAVLGQGGAGTVYEATQLSMERVVAVKLLRKGLSDDADVVRRFLKEARSASRLNHPNIVTLHDFGQTADGELYLMMERLHGRTLGAILRAEGLMTPERAVPLFGQICDAIQTAHDRGVIHRDLKPDNVFVGERDHVKVLDFGLAKAAGGDGTALTQTGMVCGTPAYMSPEQATGAEVDPRSDIYALGVMLFETLSGRLPFRKSAALHQLLAHIQQPPPELSEVAPGLPEPLTAVVMRCLAKAPEERPASALALKQALEAAATAAPRPPLPTPQPLEVCADAETGVYEAPPARRAPRRWARWASLAAAVSLVGGLGGWWATQAPAPEPEVQTPSARTRPARAPRPARRPPAAPAPTATAAPAPKATATPAPTPAPKATATPAPRREEAAETHRDDRRTPEPVLEITAPPE